LSDIYDSARNSPGDSELFFKHQVKGNPKQSLFKQFCIAMKFDSENSLDRSKAFEYLRRLRFDTFPDDETAWRYLLTQTGFIFQRFKSAIESLVNDDNPVILVATMRILVPLLHIDKEQAVSWFCTASKLDLRVPTLYHGSRFIGYTIREFPHEYLFHSTTND
jgi:hypothetical protein